MALRISDYQNLICYSFLGKIIFVISIYQKVSFLGIYYGKVSFGTFGHLLGVNEVPSNWSYKLLNVKDTSLDVKTFLKYISHLSEL